MHAVHHILFPKKEPFDFRRAALMQPLDTIIYLALVLTFVGELEKHRPLPSKKKVFSYRFKPRNGLLFDTEYNFTSFEQHVAKKILQKKTKVLIKCDIANFYDKLNLHRLESSLLSLGIDKIRIKQVDELLKFWANRDSYGLPTGGNASRILAEAALIPIDAYLQSHKINFCRFVDDYRFFAPDIKTAHVWLTLFIERLFLEGLSLNPAKTVIQDVSSKNTHLSSKTQTPLPNSITQSPLSRKLIVGYSGTVPTKFRALSEKEAEELKKENLNTFLQELNNQVILLPKDIGRFLRMIVAQNDFEKFRELPFILERFPQFTSLAIDLLIKKSTETPEAIKNELKIYFSNKLVDIDQIPEYILLAIIRLFGSENYASKEILFIFFRNLKRNSGHYVGRAVLDALQPLVSRNDVLEIRQSFNRSDTWERRAIIRMINKALPEEEKRPWIKNVKLHCSDDIFAIETTTQNKI